MTTATLALTDFLLARIAEDEAAARHRDTVTFGAERRRVANEALHDPFDPARVLAECEAKRRIVDYREQVASESAATGVPIFEAQLSAYDAALRALAVPYAEHPDYRDEWRP
jgi:hypothetical protein